MLYDDSTTGLDNKMKSKKLECTQMVNVDMGVVTDTDPNDFYPFNNRQLVFIEEFSKDFDPVRAAKDAGYSNPKSAANSLMCNEKIKEQCKKIYDASFVALGMTAKMVLARHLLFMEKVEKDYDSVEDVEKRGSLASAFAKMSGDSLRAVGLFGVSNEKQTTSVVVNIGFSEPIKEQVGVIIDGNGKSDPVTIG